MLNLVKPKIDSLRVIIPLENVKINPDQMNFFNSILYTRTSTNTGETIEWEDQPTTYFNLDAVISCSYSYAKNQYYENTQKDVIKIGFSSKLCKELYFEGINKNTIKRCLNFINNEGLISITEKDFINAKVVDVDICIDYFLKDTTCKDVVSIANKLTIAKKGLILPAPNMSKTNIGIQWSARKSVKTAYKKKQFLKYYSKVEELKYKSFNFYNEYILPQLNFRSQPCFLDNRLLRCETTIKNKAHFKTYNLTVDTLYDLLELDLDNQLIFFNRPINIYMSSLKRIVFNPKLSPTDRLILRSIDRDMKTLCLPYMDVINLIVNDLQINDKSQKSKYIKRLYELYTTSKKETAENKQLKLDLSTLEMSNIGLIPKL